jgi:hypothetical protein
MPYVTIEVSLDSFSDEDIENEAEERGLHLADLRDDELEKIYRAMVNGDREMALNLMCDFLRDHLGRVL